MIKKYFKKYEITEKYEIADEIQNAQEQYLKEMSDTDKRAKQNKKQPTIITVQNISTSCVTDIEIISDTEKKRK